MRSIKYFLLGMSILTLLACNAVAGLAPTSTPPIIPATATPNPSATPTIPPVPTASPTPLDPLTLAHEKIKHIVIIMQENRSFDSYFGTYPRRGRISNTPMASSRSA
jgi:phospholipase C